MDVQQLYERPLVDLGLGAIWVSADLDARTVDRYVQAQFRARAEQYVEHYTDYAHSQELLDAAFAVAGFRALGSPLRVLDVCSGAGNSVVPLLKTLPGAELVATDLSVEMLVILDRVLRRLGLRDRVALMQLNAEELHFAAQAFDLVVGAAALHHLLQPEKAIRHCGRILKPGGLAIFFEPFETGNAFLAAIYDQILQDSRARQIAPEIREQMCRFMRDIEFRRGSDKSDPGFETVDDKWLFTRHFFEHHAREAGFRECTIRPTIPPGTDLFRSVMGVNLRLGTCRPARPRRLGLPMPHWLCTLRAAARAEVARLRTPSFRRGALLCRSVPVSAPSAVGAGENVAAVLPGWAWEIVRRFDAIFTSEAAQELLTVGCVILRK